MKPATLSMTASRWNVEWSEFMPAHPTQDGAGWKITIPQGEGLPVKLNPSSTVPELDYLVCPHTKFISATYLEMKVRMEAAPTTWLDYCTEPGNTSGAPANMRFLLYRDMSSEYGRWWSNPFCIYLAPGSENTLRVPLTPTNWSSVFGKFANQDNNTRDGFANCLRAPRALGVTFGGGSFFSHGLVSRNGPTTIQMDSFSLIP